MADIPLTPEQEAEAQVLYQRLLQAFTQEAQQLARLMASKADAQLLGATEFQLRDRLLQLGAQVLQTALEERKKGGTAVPVPLAPTVRRRHAASAGGDGRSSP